MMDEEKKIEHTEAPDKKVAPIKLPSGNITVVKQQEGRGIGLKAGKEFETKELITIYASSPWKGGKMSIEEYTRCFYDSTDPNETMFISDRMRGECGGFVNDGCSAKTIRSLSKCSFMSEITRWIERYSAETSQTANTEFVRIDNSVFVRALKTIKQGEDLFVKYGPIYWIDLASLDTNLLPITRAVMVCYVLFQGGTSLPIIANIHGIGGIWNSFVDPPVMRIQHGSGYDPSILQSLSQDEQHKVSDEIHSNLLSVLGFVNKKGLRDWLDICESVHR
jgi:hypothetical protein